MTLSAETARHRVISELRAIKPNDDIEQAHWSQALAWATSDAPLFRTAKPATPRTHLVSYFAVIDEDHILLVDHRNAQMWLPTGGHVEPDEDPRQTVVRESKEELGIDVSLKQLCPPVLVTVTETVGLTAGHTDISLWYVVNFSRSRPLQFDTEEFVRVRWFSFAEASTVRSDPHLQRFLEKLNRQK